MPKGTAMRTAPSILLLDDGELGQARSVLAGFGTDFAHFEGNELGNAVALPRDLLVTSLRLALEVPAFEHPEGMTLEPTWICVADQDCRALRTQLRDLGVHYLVDAQLDSESMRLFFLQLLSREMRAHNDPSSRDTLVMDRDCDSERRTHPRKEYRSMLWALGGEQVAVVLGRDLSLTGIQIEGDSSLAVGDRLELALYGGTMEEPLVLQATAVRDEPERGLGLRFLDLTAAQTEVLQAMLADLPPLESLQDGSGVVVSQVRKSS